jgi:hypothetical protein
VEKYFAQDKIDLLIRHRQQYFSGVLRHLVVSSRGGRPRSACRRLWPSWRSRQDCSSICHREETKGRRGDLEQIASSPRHREEAFDAPLAAGYGRRGDLRKIASSICHREEAKGDLAISGRLLPRFVIARRPKADVAISARLLRR